MTKIQCRIVLEWEYTDGVEEIGLYPAWRLCAGSACLAYITKPPIGKWTFGGSVADIGASVCEEAVAKSKGIKCVTSYWDDAELPQLKQMVEEQLICDLESRG